MPARAGMVALLGVLLAYVALPLVHGLSPHHHHGDCSHGVSVTAGAPGPASSATGPGTALEAPERDFGGACVLCLAKRIGSGPADPDFRPVRLAAVASVGVLANDRASDGRSSAPSGAGGPRAPPLRASV